MVIFLPENVNHVAVRKQINAKYINKNNSNWPIEFLLHSYIYIYVKSSFAKTDNTIKLQLGYFDLVKKIKNTTITNTIKHNKIFFLIKENFYLFTFI